MVAKSKAKPAAKASAKPKSGKLSAMEGMKMREELDEETMENKIKDAGLKSMGYKKGGMVKPAAKSKAKPKGYMCGGKVKK